MSRHLDSDLNPLLAVGNCTLNLLSKGKQQFLLGGRGGQYYNLDLFLAPLGRQKVQFGKQLFTVIISSFTFLRLKKLVSLS